MLLCDMLFPCCRCAGVSVVTKRCLCSYALFLLLMSRCLDSMPLRIEGRAKSVPLFRSKKWPFYPI